MILLHKNISQISIKCVLVFLKKGSNTMKFLLMVMMKMLPKKIRDSMQAPMIEKTRMAVGQKHPTIAMNITNLIICAQNCGTCPSYPNVTGEALYCASGASAIQVEEKGCNCVSCPLIDQCSRNNAVYFCIHGSCSSKDNEDSGSFGNYLDRFILPSQEILSQNSLPSSAEAFEDKEVLLKFTDEKDIDSVNGISLLQASLNAGIPHVHVCGGRGRCSTCRVIVTQGLENCLPRNEKEVQIAVLKGFSAEVRLACQTKVTGDISLRRLVLDNGDIAEAIEGKLLKESGREVDATILFSDIRSFTSFSEKSLPYDVVHILNRYFGLIGEIIDKNGGYIDKYMGDGIMVIFGLDKNKKEDHAFLAAQTSIEMLRVLHNFNKYLEKYFSHRFAIGIGVHSGKVIVGNLGFHKKKDYTAIGDTVNTASRIESLTKKAKTAILFSDESFLRIEKNFQWGKVYQAKVKGKEEKIIVHELLDKK